MMEMPNRSTAPMAPAAAKLLRPPREAAKIP
jgi:hypothetical protein